MLAGRSPLARALVDGYLLMSSDIFAQITGGRFLPLVGRLTAAEVEQLGRIMKKTCPDCGGAGITAVAMVMTQAGILPLPVLCELCEGDGDVMYRCYN